MHKYSIRYKECIYFSRIDFDLKNKMLNAYNILLSHMYIAVFIRIHPWHVVKNIYIIKISIYLKKSENLIYFSLKTAKIIIL